MVNAFTEIQGQIIYGSMQYGVFSVIFLGTVDIYIHNKLMSRTTIICKIAKGGFKKYRPQMRTEYSFTFLLRRRDNCSTGIEANSVIYEVKTDGFQGRYLHIHTHVTNTLLIAPVMDSYGYNIYQQERYTYRPCNDV